MLNRDELKIFLNYTSTTGDCSEISLSADQNGWHGDVLLGDGEDVNSPPPQATSNLRLIPQNTLWQSTFAYTYF